MADMPSFDEYESNYKCKCESWAMNHTAQQCRDIDRPAVEWNEKDSPRGPKLFNKYCCEWSYEDDGAQKNNFPCSHSPCKMQILSTVNKVDFTARCGTQKEAEQLGLVLMVVCITLLALSVFGLVSLFCSFNPNTALFISTSFSFFCLFLLIEIISVIVVFFFIFVFIDLY